MFIGILDHRRAPRSAYSATTSLGLVLTRPPSLEKSLGPVCVGVVLALAICSPTAAAAESQGRSTERWETWNPPPPVVAEPPIAPEGLERLDRPLTRESIQSGFGPSPIDTAVLASLLKKRLTDVQTRVLQDLLRSKSEIADTLAVADLLSATSSFVVPGGAEKSKGQLLLYAVVRAGLSIGIGGVLTRVNAPIVVNCGNGAAGLPALADTAYEALAQSAIGGGLAFSEAEQKLPADCHELANLLVKAIDAAVAIGRDPPSSSNLPIRLLQQRSLIAEIAGGLGVRALSKADEKMLDAVAGVIIAALQRGGPSRAELLAVVTAIQERVEADVKAGSMNELAGKLLLSILGTIPNALVEDRTLSIDAAQVAAQLALDYADFTAEGFYLRATIGAGYVFTDVGSPGRLAQPVYYEELGVGYRARLSSAVMAGGYLAASGLLFSISGPEATEDAIWLGAGASLNLYELIELGVFGGWQSRPFGGGGKKNSGFFVVGVQLPLADYLSEAGSALGTDD